MSGEILCKLLGSIGYRPVDKKLTPDALEWMFIGEDSNTAFLRWFCENISTKNVISDQELKEFSLLRQEGQELHGAELSTALKELNQINQDSEEESLLLEVEELERQIKPLKAQEAKLAARFSTLQNQLQSTRQRTQQLSKLQSSKTDNYLRTLHPKLQLRNDQLEILSSSLEANLSSFTNLHSNALSSNGSSIFHSPFLSTSSWVEYYENESACTRALRVLSKQLLSSEDEHAVGQSNPTSDHERTSYYWVHGKEAPKLSFRGADADTHAQHCQELSRTRSMYPTSEFNKTSAEMKLARSMAKLEAVKLQLINDPFAAMDECSLQIKAKEFIKRLQRCQTLLQRNVNVILPELYNELAKLQSTSVLWADYNMKLARLMFRGAKLDRVFNHLLGQHARQRYLMSLLNNQKSQHISDYALITSLKTEVRRISLEFDSRWTGLKYASEHPPNTSTLRTLLEMLYQMISNSQLPYSQQKTLEAVSKLARRIENSKTVQAQQALAEDSKIDLLHSSLVKLNRMIFDSNKKAHLTPSAIADACAKVEFASASLTTAMESTLREHAQHSKQLLELSKEQLFERNMWLYFFGNPSGFKTIQLAFDEINNKIAALRVSHTEHH